MKIIYILLLTLFLGCNEQSHLTFTTFNIKWLGDGVNDNIERSEKDYGNLWNILKSLDSDVIGFQEIENKNALVKVLDTNQYAIITSSYPTEQKTALAIDKKIDVIEIYQLDEIALGNRDLRPGLVAYCDYNGYDFFVGSFHFKATSRHDNTPVKRTRSFDMRQDQSKYLVAAINKLMSERNDTDVILMGDFNDNPAKENTNISAIDTDEFDFLTAEMNSCKFPRLKSIDHMVVSQSVKKLVNKSSINMFDLSRSLMGDELRAASDHCPVSMSINIK